MKIAVNLVLVTVREYENVLDVNVSINKKDQESFYSFSQIWD